MSTITARMKPEEHEQIRRNAEQNGMSISKYLVQSALKEQTLTSAKERQMVREIIALENLLNDDKGLELGKIHERITALWHILSL